MATAAPGPAAQNMTHEERKVLAGTLVGTTIEWYDFFIYAQAAALVLSAQYFGPPAAGSPALGQIMACAALGSSCRCPRRGAISAGHRGHRIGPKQLLVLALILLGAATSLIGLLPHCARIGVSAPTLLALRRILPGFRARGEWGGAG